VRNFIVSLGGPVPTLYTGFPVWDQKLSTKKESIFTKRKLLD